VKQRTKVTLGGNAGRKRKADLSNTYGIKPGSAGTTSKTGAVTMRKAPMAQRRIPKS
jgi:hypothetical protein